MHKQLLCELYQVLGVLDAPNYVLDQVIAAVDGKPLPYNTLLPFTININKGCKRKLEPGQWWGFCGETDMGQSLPALCVHCGGEYLLDDDND